MKAITYPAWFNGPAGQAAIFEAAEDVPKGWTSGAEMQSPDASPAKPKPAPAPTSKPTPAKAEELDADGHPYDAALHAGTGSKTKAGLWRMKVGVARPDPAPGYPLDL